MEVLRRLFAGDPPGVDKSVVVVSGLPRSGTSMLMSMISAGGLEEVVDGVRQADDDNPRGYHALEAVKDLDKNGDTAWLDDAHGKVVKIISFLLQHLPATHHYKIVFVRRSLQEVLASQQKMLDRRGASGGNAADAEMARVFAAHLNKVERQLAARKLALGEAAKLLAAEAERSHAWEAPVARGLGRTRRGPAARQPRGPRGQAGE